MAHQLRAASFACKVDTLNVRSHSGPTRIEYAGHGIRDSNPVLRINWDVHHIRLSAHSNAQISKLRRQLPRIDHVRTIKSAAHRDPTDGACQLDRAYRNRTLPDTHRYHFACVPLLTEGLHLPLF